MATKPNARPDHPTDCNVGRQIWLRRRELGLSRRKLGDMIGVGLKQVNKYELGINRVSAGRLYEIAGVLKVPVGYFFQDDVMSDLGALGKPPASEEECDNSEIQALLNVYRAIPPDVRGRFLRLVRSIADTNNG